MSEVIQTVDSSSVPAHKPNNADQHWRIILRNAIRNPATLWQRLQLDVSYLPAAKRAASAFPLLVPEPFLARMHPGDIHDPLLRQILPLDAEMDSAESYVTDAVGDVESMQAPGLLHKYHGRVLLVVSGACAIHCRYCFRRHFPYSRLGGGREQWQSALDYITHHKEVEEVILSGGDPLSLDDPKLINLMDRLMALENVRTLRIHTRTAIVIPQRITVEILAWIKQQRKQIILVTHVNHANELDDTTAEALLKLRQAGALLLNQSVLLKNVNDCGYALTQLSRKLSQQGVLPYYLHMLDPVTGAAHFFVSAAQAASLMTQIAEVLPGYLVPRLVREIPEAPAKTPLWWNL